MFPRNTEIANMMNGQAFEMLKNKVRNAPCFIP